MQCQAVAVGPSGLQKVNAVDAWPTRRLLGGSERRRERVGQAASAVRRRVRATAAEGHAADEPHVREERGVQFVTDGAFYRKESAEVRTTSP
jgi:hypothetical protein